MSVEDLVGYAAVRSAIHEGQRVRPVPGHADDRDQRVRQDAADGGVGLEVFELQYECVQFVSVMKPDSCPPVEDMPKPLRRRLTPQ